MKPTTLCKKTFMMSLLCSLLALTSCGGSNSTTELKSDLPSPVAKEIKGNTLVEAPPGNDPAPATELALLPTITVNQRQFADPNVLLNLNATVTAATGATIVSTLWTQVTGPTVRIPSPLQVNNEVIIPDVAVATTLEFRLTAQDSKGKINSATISILVKPVPAFVKVIGGVFDETETAAVFTLRLNAASSVPITFTYTTQDGSAAAGSDYMPTSGQATFAAGDLGTTLVVPLLDDALSEADETFSLQVSTSDGETIYTNSGIAIIHDESELLKPQSLSFSNASQMSLTVGAQGTNALTASSGTGAVIYHSSNPQVASVDANGLLTALTQGTTTITATKASDAIYAAAEASYQLQVQALGMDPIVTIADINLTPLRTLSLLPGEALVLRGSARDKNGTDLPLTPLWTSNIDGTIVGDNGNAFANQFSQLSQGTHTITLSVTDTNGKVFSSSIRVFVGNVAPLATTLINRQSLNCGDTESDKIIDADLTTIFNPGCGESAVVSLSWAMPVTINTIEIYTDASEILSHFEVDTGQSGGPSETANMDLEKQYVIPVETLDFLNFRTFDGGVINEVVVYGQIATEPITGVIHDSRNR